MDLAGLNAHAPWRSGNGAAVEIKLFVKGARPVGRRTRPERQRVGAIPLLKPVGGGAEPVHARFVPFLPAIPIGRLPDLVKVHSTVTDFARLRGWSTSVPLVVAVK